MLQAVKPLVQTATGEQLAVRAALAHFAVVQHENLGSAHNRAQPMGDRDRRPPRHKHEERLVDCGFVLAVDRDGGFVQHEERGIRGNGAGERQQLTLTDAALREFNALAERCVQLEDPCRTGQVAIVIDNEVVSAPAVRATGFGRDDFVVSGDFDKSTAESIVGRLTA